MLYCWELQVEAAAKRKGLGRFLMQLLELLARRCAFQAISCLKKASLCWPTAAFHQICFTPRCAPRRPGLLVAPGNPFGTDAAALHLPCSACWCSAVRLNQSLAAGRILSAANRHGVQMQLQGASHKV